MTLRARWGPWPGAVVATAAMVVAVTTSHLGRQAGIYSTSRPAVSRHNYPLPWDGFLLVWEGVPTQADAWNSCRLQRLFLGASGPAAGGIQDFRPLPSLLHASAGASWLGPFRGEVLVNLLVLLVAGACAVDLGRRLGGTPLVAASFGLLVVGGRGVGFYAGCPDGHTFSLAWLPIGLWGCERLRACEARALPGAVPILAGLWGLAALSYLSTLLLLPYLWLRGAGRAPWSRLAMISAGTLLVLLGWRAIGDLAGLPFDSHTDGWIRLGLRDMWSEVRDRAMASTWTTPPPGSGPLNWAHAAASACVRHLPLRSILCLSGAVRPAFGLPLLSLAAAGVLVAGRGDRRFALACFFPACAMAWPILFHWNAPRLCYPGWVGLSWLAAVALGAAYRRGKASLVRLKVPPHLAEWMARGALLAGLLGFLAFENQDVWGSHTVAIGFHHGLWD